MNYTLNTEIRTLSLLKCEQSVHSIAYSGTASPSVTNGTDLFHSDPKPLSLLSDSFGTVRIRMVLFFKVNNTFTVKKRCHVSLFNNYFYNVNLSISKK